MKKRLRPVMFVGTCSDAGKSVLAAAFCRIFKQDGYSPAPFKAQNMSLNSFATREGGEMGRAQVVQAEACGIDPHTDMNPVLLKPGSDSASQVIVNGKVWKNQSAKEYFGNQSPHTELFEQAIQAFKRLENQYNPIVMEGAGSISELNLKERDITNMRMAARANAATYLIADIDRGGVFGSVYGTIALLEPEEKALIKGIIINKFRGDVSLFEEGKKILEKLTGIPVVGIIPYFRDIQIEAEDSVALDMKNNSYREGKINVAIVLLKRMSNFTDFDVLEKDSRFNPYYTQSIDEIDRADIILLPGTKNTIADLQDLRSKGITEAILRNYKAGKKVIGICGGYQMMGEEIEDPAQHEGILPRINGLGLLPIHTIIENEKVTRQRTFSFLSPDTFPNCKGYEIHMGTSRLTNSTKESPVNFLSDGQTEGYYLNNHCWGTYMHGILDNPEVLNHLAKDFTPTNRESTFNYTTFKEEQYNKLADHIRRHIDIEYIYSNL